MLESKVGTITDYILPATAFLFVCGALPMKTLVRPTSKTSLPENAMARTAIEAVAQIDAEAKQKKMVQLESLQSAKAAIQKRVEELDHQIAQIDTVIASITGSRAPNGKRARRSWDEDRNRIMLWMGARKDQKFAARDLTQEFPELEGVVMSVFLKPLIQEGKVQVDAHEGIRRSKYFVAG